MLNLRNITLPLALASALVVGTLAGGAPAGASVAADFSPQVGQASIDKLGTDAMGADTARNSFKEYILIKNDTTGPVNVNGWSTQDTWSHANNTAELNPKGCNTVTFTAVNLPFLDTMSGAVTGLWLPAGETITVYSGGARDTRDDANHFVSLNKWRCGLAGHYLNNNNDTAYLVDGQGLEVDHKSYDFHGGYTVE